MENLGELLQRHRSGAGYTLEDVARITRINPHYLQALEENDFSKLPAFAFTQGFLRSYARLLSLDERDIIRRYQQALDASSKQRGRAVPETDAQSVAQKMPWQTIWPPLLVGLVLLVSLVSLSVWWSLQRDQGPGNLVSSRSGTPLPGQSLQEPENRPGSEPVNDRTKSLPADTLPPPPLASPVASGIEEKPLPSGSPLVLSFRAIEQSWVRVVLDDGKVDSILLPAGGRIQWEAQERFLVTLGNAGGVEADLNSKKLGPFGVSGQVIRNLVITREGTSMTPGRSTPPGGESRQGPP